jgi:hypothetical protein
MRRPLLLLAAFALAGWLFGLLDSHIPMPTSATLFWLGNLGSPWIVLPFCAGWVQRSKQWALLSGAVTCSASMVGFFGPGGGWGAASQPFVASWLAVALLSGAVYGLFGDGWRRSRGLLDGLALAVPFILEPLAWSWGLGYSQGRLPIWYAEIVVGLALLVWVVAASRRRALRHRGAGTRGVGL